ncbi:MAG: hypothetical protein MK179_20010 [Pirellulaceae bacterium]|nr:hypothetical protein [Pirellulaceae bacterium]
MSLNEKRKGKVCFVSLLRFGVSLILAVLVGNSIGYLSIAGGAEAPDPKLTRYEERVAPYSVVIFTPPPDERQCRELLTSIRAMGATHSFASVHWWQMETLGGKYEAEMGYRPGLFGEPSRKAFENYIRISEELGMKSAVRVGTFRSTKGLFHPMDKTGDVRRYADWLRGFARRYRGKIEHYVVGDELNKSFPAWKWRGTPEECLRMFIPIARAIHDGDPGAKVSPASTSSSPATDWIMRLIELGLPQHADGVACHFNHQRIEDLDEIKDLMRRVRAVWPEAKFYGNGFGYVDNTRLHDHRQAGIVAQCAFTLWDIGWDSFPYYTYRFSRTADTRQNFGLMQPAVGGKPAQYSDAWKAYATIAHTFYNRSELASPAFKIQLRQTETLAEIEGVRFTIAPPNPVMRAFIRKEKELLIYLAYRKFREPVAGTWNMELDTDEWETPELISLLDHRVRRPMATERTKGRLTVKEIPVGLHPVILSFRRVTR